MPPQIAGETIVRAVERRQARILVGRDAKIAATLESASFPVTALAPARADLEVEAVAAAIRPHVSRTPVASTGA